MVGVCNFFFLIRHSVWFSFTFFTFLSSGAWLYFGCVSSEISPIKLFVNHPLTFFGSPSAGTCTLILDEWMDGE